MIRRRSGILNHITSLPSPCGIGDFGPGAYRFADFLHETRQSLWQILPLNPTSTTYGNSPYSSCSAFAGNPLLISPEVLVGEGFLGSEDLNHLPTFSQERVDFEAVTKYKTEVLQRATERFRGTKHNANGQFETFLRENAKWLEDYALFVALKERFGGAPWVEWPHEFRDRNGNALAEAKEEMADRVFHEFVLQYFFARQWGALRTYCHERRIQLFGDMPIYVSMDSSDVWSNPTVFKLNADKKPLFVAGVPPDYFSATGQRWGNPVYDWNHLRGTRFAWWIDRMGHALKQLDLVRLDHFRGFVNYWEVPSCEETAIHGEWIDAPAMEFFATLLRRFPFLPIVAEDLGIITAEVREVMGTFGFPGMKILQFGFHGDVRTNPYAPHNHTRDSVIYTGTHDNNTTRGWFRKDLSAGDREQLSEYLGRSMDEQVIHMELVRVAMMSVADTCVIPLQDFLGLDEGARMNHPSVSHGNWEWRLSPELLTDDLRRAIARLTRLYGRA